MADYSSDDISNLYGTLLGLNSGSVSASLKTVQDGDGNNTALQVSTTSVKSTGTIESTGNATVGGSVTATGYNGSARAMSNVFGASASIRTVASGTAAIDTNDEVIQLNGATAFQLADPADYDGRFIYVVNLTNSAVPIDFNGQTIFNNGAASTGSLNVRAYTGQILMGSATGTVWILVSGTLS